MSATIIGLTGQSGAGKTTVSAQLERCGFAVINCDIIARRAVEPNTECAKELEGKFPQLFSDGRLDRKKAAHLLFTDSELLAGYNAAIFPHINALITQEIRRLELGGCEYILLDAPTLFEAGADKLCGAVISCVADESVRLERITRRDDITEQAARERFSSQHSEDFFRERSEYIIENNGDRKSAEEQARKIATEIINGGD